MRKCSVEGCEKKHRGRGYCVAHYARHMKGMDMNKPLRPSPGETKGCSVSGCNLEHAARGYCVRHWKSVYSKLTSGKKCFWCKVSLVAYNGKFCSQSCSASHGQMLRKTQKWRIFYREIGRKGGAANAARGAEALSHSLHKRYGWYNEDGTLAGDTGKMLTPIKGVHYGD